MNSQAFCFRLPLSSCSTRFIRHLHTGIAVGLMLTALTNAGLVTLTSTPMNAEGGIRKLLNRPVNEKVYMLMPVGYPHATATMPYRDHTTLRRSLADITSYFD
eukprot:m.141802 g.141802  ORF g.141802 m.141802 type:complete len:103 (-) comp20385_c0_seq9:21-329(-)